MSSTAVVAAVYRDTTAFRAGEVAGVAVLLLLGIALVVVGVRQRRRPAPAPALPPPGPSYPTQSAQPAGNDDYFAAPPVPPAPQWAPGPAPAATSSSGTALLVGGVVLVLLGLVAAVGVVPDLSYPKRTIAVPDTLLGEPRNTAVSASLKGQFQGSLPAEIKTSDIAAFGGAQPDLFVIAGTGHLSSPGSELRSFETGLTRNGQISVVSEHAVPAGALGGAGRCYDARIQSIPLQVCAYADRGSLFATLDRAANPGTAPGRSLQAREAVISQG